MKKTNAKLDALLEKEKALNEQIKKAKAEQRKQEAETMRQRAQVLGFALMAEMAENQTLAAQIEPLLNARVIVPKDRVLMGLSPLAKNDNKPAAVSPEAAKKAPEENKL